MFHENPLFDFRLPSLGMRFHKHPHQSLCRQLFVVELHTELHTDTHTAHFTAPRDHYHVNLGSCLPP